MNEFMEADDDWFVVDVQDARDEPIVEQEIIERAARSAQVVRKVKQGIRRFRLHNPKRGQKVMVLKISKAKGTATVTGARGQRVVSLADLHPLA